MLTVPLPYLWPLRWYYRYRERKSLCASIKRLCQKEISPEYFTVCGVHLEHFWDDPKEETCAALRITVRPNGCWGRLDIYAAIGCMEDDRRTIHVQAHSKVPWVQHFLDKAFPGGVFTAHEGLAVDKDFRNILWILFDKHLVC